MNSEFKKLCEILSEINDISSASAVLYWDQATYMPTGGARARAQQLATLRKLAHEKMTSPSLGHLLDRLKSSDHLLPPDSFETSLIRVADREFRRAQRVPAEFMSRFSQHTSSVYEAWAAARAQKESFAKLVPYLEKTLELSLEYSSFFPEARHPADPLIDQVDEGISALTVKNLFTELRAELVPLVRAVTSRSSVGADSLTGVYDLKKQLSFGEEVIRKFGYDFSRGRQDMTPHPFMIKFSLGDVRITTRVKENDLTEALFSTMHEAGHALYEQGCSEVFEGTPLAGGASAGIHESQSRLWENLVGRSREFWTYFYPKLCEVFPDPLNKISFEDFYRAINLVKLSLIRTDADEVTYNLHVMIRFDLECALLESRLAIKDLKEAWNERYLQDLGVVPEDDNSGVMQDVHWYSDFIGGQFQGYAIGNILSAQFFDAAVEAFPQIRTEMTQGCFDTLRGWLKQNIHQFGKKFLPEDVVRRATGNAMSIEPYVNYLKKKYTQNLK